MGGVDQRKVLVVTGASSGIGEALALKYSQSGYAVVLAARNEQKLKQLEGRILEGGGDALAVVADVSRQDDCKNLINQAIRKYGRLDILINNAGISMRSLFKDLHMDVFHRLMEVNFWGTVYCTHYALPYLLESGGSVVGVSSVAGFKGLPARAAYSSSKAAMHGFLDVLRLENRKTGVHVLLACPGFTASNIRKNALTADGSPQGETPRDENKMMSAREVANHIFGAVKKRKSMIVLTKEGKMAWWLSRFFPKWLDKIVYNQMAKEPGSPIS